MWEKMAYLEVYYGSPRSLYRGKWENERSLIIKRRVEGEEFKEKVNTQ